MKIDNVRFGFATNSSSSHSLVFLKRPVDDDYVDGRFGWDYFTAASKKAKDQYAAITLAEAFKESGLPQHIVNDLIAKWSGVDPKKFITDADMNNYIDHQSVMAIPCEFGTRVPDKQFFEHLQKFLRQSELAILGGNDNNDEYHPLGGGSFCLNIPQDAHACYFVCRYDEQHRFWTIFNRHDGTKIRMRFLKDGPNDFRPVKASAPELVDIKITDRCGFGCPFCYQGSTPGGKDAKTGDLATLAEALGQLKVFEVACLTGDTWAFGPNGGTKIRDLKIGDEVYDGQGRASKIIRIHKSIRKSITITGTKGFSAQCTEDHPFMVGGNVVSASDTLNRNLDVTRAPGPEKAPVIDLAVFISRPSPAKIGRGGAQGGAVTTTKVRLTHTSEWVNRFITVDEEVAWLYGLVVAEGSSGDTLSLHANEQHLAVRAAQIYERITGLKNSVCVRKNGKNGISAVFRQRAVFENVFFKAMRVGVGAHNKSFNFAFCLPNRHLKAALRGLFDGDGCYRSRKNKRYVDFSISLKTVSERLAQEVAYLMSVRLNIFASVHRGISPRRCIEDRLLKKGEYFKVDCYGKQNIDKLFPNYFQHNAAYRKIGNSIYSTNKNKDRITIQNIANSGIATVYDITLENSSDHIFTLSHGVQTHNCGGGEPTEHPDFLEILHRFKRHGVTPNFTTKSMAWMRDPARFSPILANCGAFAYSISGRRDLEKFNMLRLDSGLERGMDGSEPKATVQLVMGTVEEGEFCMILEYCAEQRLPITLLGFKEVGRGATFKKLPYPWLIKRLSAMEARYLIGVDTAIIAEFEQELVALDVPSVLYTKEEGKFSCYIDAVSGRIGPSSYCAESAYKPLDLKAYRASKIADSIACSFGTF